MLVTCPNCQSVFKLPDTDNKNLKMRCSICTEVFRLADAIVLEEPLEDTLSQEANSGENNGESQSFKLTSSLGNKKKKETGKAKSMFMRLVLILFFSLVFAGAALWKYTSYLDPLSEMLGFGSKINEEVVSKQLDAIAEFNRRVEFLEIADVRQFVVPNEDNDKFEKLAVIEGKVINTFKEPRSFVELEATLYDEKGAPIVTKTQMAGPHVSLFQLQVLGQVELEEALRDQISILNYNVDIQPQDSVPFMFIFYNPPEAAVNFNVKIVGAQLPEVAPEKATE